MFRRILTTVSRKLKGLTMAETTPLSANDNAGEKRPLDVEDKETEEPADKKIKFQPAPPMQGRTDRKRKVALLLAYCGAGYYGIQIQRKGDFKTIESELIKALVAAELIPEEHAENPSKMSFQRAARTDKNVSAIGNCISLKMLYGDAVSEKINPHLPPEIRVITCIRTTQGFDAKNHCTARTYKYMLPTYSFAPVEKFITKEYRIQDGGIQRVNEVLGKYVGTHNFHNFTSGRKPNDPSSKRYIISFECAEPFVRDGMEFAVITVKGQSFMLHHIRKMIGLMIAIVRGHCGLEAMTKSWEPMKVDIPKAPGVGLFLDQLFFRGYNNKFGKDGIHEPLVWDKHQDFMEAFKEEHVLSHIAAAEAKEGVMLNWLGTLQFHKFDVIDPQEEVPEEGEKDRNWWKTKRLLNQMDKDKQKAAAGGTDAKATSNTPDSKAPVEETPTADAKSDNGCDAKTENQNTTDVTSVDSALTDSKTGDNSKTDDKTSKE